MGVVSLEEYRRRSEGPVVCIACGDNWWAVRPSSAHLAECPNCDTMTGYSFHGMMQLVEKQMGEVFTDRLRVAIDVEFNQ